jgi:hypothetical protein
MSQSTPQGNTGAEVSLHSLLTSVLDGNEWSTSRPVRFTQGKETQYPLSKRLGGSQSRSPRFGKGKDKVHPCTGTEALYRPYGP